MRRRILNILIAIDQFILCVVTLGWAHPDETISSCLWRFREHHWTIDLGRQFVDLLFKPFEDDHCFRAYMAEVRRSHTFKHGDEMAEQRKCQECGKEFKAVIIHPSVIFCSGECEKKHHKVFDETL